MTGGMTMGPPTPINTMSADSNHSGAIDRYHGEQRESDRHDGQVRQ